MITPEQAKKLLQTYEEAWVEQDCEKIISLFHEDGVYHEYVLEKPYVGHEEIRSYWQRKVCEEQSRIEFTLLHHYIAGDTLIAEWDASFDSNVKQARIHLKEVAIMAIKQGKIRSLREYWHAEKKPFHPVN